MESPDTRIGAFSCELFGSYVSVGQSSAYANLFIKKNNEEMVRYCIGSSYVWTQNEPYSLHLTFVSLIRIKHRLLVNFGSFSNEHQRMT